MASFLHAGGIFWGWEEVVGDLATPLIAGVAARSPGLHIPMPPHHVLGLQQVPGDLTYAPARRGVAFEVLLR